eukprot:4370401-Alexandrium_andersonii.AAC.1
MGANRRNASPRRRRAGANRRCGSAPRPWLRRCRRLTPTESHRRQPALPAGGLTCGSQVRARS